MNIRNETLVNRKIAMGFVIYEPEETIIERLNLALVQGFDLYIFDNSPEKSIVRDLCLSGRNLGNCKYITCGKNVGLGFGISSICAQAYYDSFSTLLFFDQDTIFDANTISFIQEFMEGKFDDVKNEYSAIVFNSKNCQKEIVEPKFHIVNVDLVISSGSLFILKKLKEIGWHNERYFVDGVDYEMCLRSLAHNLKVGECRNTPGHDHSSEQPDREYKIMGFTFSLRRYSSSRVIDASKSSIKLVVSSILVWQPKFALLILRSYSIYLAAQILVRIKGG